MGTNKKKVVLAGINHAGTTALKTIAKHYKDWDIIGYDRNDNISFLGCGIALWVGEEFKNPDGLFYANAANLESKGATIYLEHELITVDKKNKIATFKNLKNNETIEQSYDKLILGIGSWPILNPGGKTIPGLIADTNEMSEEEKLKGVKLNKGIYLSKLYQHAQDIKKALKTETIKDVVVVGAGYIGIELVEAFYRAGKKVTLIDFADRIMPRYYDPEFTNDLEADMTTAGVNLQLQQTVQEFKLNSENHVETVVTNKGAFKADLVIMAVGFMPNTSCLKTADNESIIKLNPNGTIIVDEYFQTSDPDIYAIGDAIAIWSNAFQNYANIALATNAVRSGIIAGLNACAEKAKDRIAFPGVQGTNAIAVFDWKLSATGLSEVSGKMILGADAVECSYLEDSVLPPFMQENHNVKLKVIWNKKTREIIGAEIGSKNHDHTEAIYMFSLAIMKKVTIDELPLIDLYFLPHFNKPYNFITKLGLLATNILDDEATTYKDPYNDNNSINKEKY